MPIGFSNLMNKILPYLRALTLCIIDASWDSIKDLQLWLGRLIERALLSSFTCRWAECLNSEELFKRKKRVCVCGGGNTIPINYTKENHRGSLLAYSTQTRCVFSDFL